MAVSHFLQQEGIKMFQQPESVKRLHKIYLSTILMLLLALIILLTMAFKPMDGKRPEPGPLLVPLLNHAVQAVGVNFKNGQPIVVDSFTGEKISPCLQLNDKKIGKRDQKSETTCKTVLKLGPDGEYQLFDAETHERIKSRAVKVVYVLWEGSECNTTFAGGSQFESCQNRDAICRKLPQLCR